MVVEAIHYNDDVLSHYSLHSYAVMPNHVHILITPFVPLPKLTKSLKSITAKRANEMLMRTGRPFWQEESYDRLIRDGQEFLRIQRYIEWNPVRAGLVSETRDYPWSSVGAAGGPRAGQGPAVQPTTTNHREALNSMQKTKVNVRVRERKPLEDLPAVRELIRAAETAFGDTGRVMVEGPDQSQVDDYATRIATQIKQDLVG